MNVGSFESKTRARQRLKQLSQDSLAQRLAEVMPDDPHEIMASSDAVALQSLIAVAIHYGVDSPEYQFVVDQIQSGVRWPATWHDVEKKMRKNPSHRRNHGNVSLLFAQPYHPGGTGFYMSSTEDWKKGLKSSRHEEFEIQFIDGDDYHAQLFNALNLTMAHVELWFDELEHLDEEDAAKLYYLSGLGYDLEESLDKMEDLILAQMTKEEWAEYRIEDINPDFYFDYDSFGRDMRLNREDPASLLYEDADYVESQGDEEEAEEMRETAAEMEKMSDQEMAEEYVDSIGGVGKLPEKIKQMYVDVDAYARDQDLNGDIDEFDFAGSTYVAEPHSI
jgi:antirestriction protein